MNELPMTQEQRADLVDASSVEYLLPKAEAFIDAVEALVYNNVES